MLLNGISSKERFNILLSSYNKLISSGIQPDEILVILLNPYKKANFINDLKKKYPQNNIENNKIYTFWGLCYNAFWDNKEFISNLIGGEDNNIPNLCGLEVSQYIFKQSIKSSDFSDYISKINLLHQLFRRYSLIVQNDLSYSEVKERSELLNEVFYKDAQKAIDDYKKKTIKFNSYDYLRQLAVLPHIYKNTDYFKNIKYLIIDDADEYSYAFWNFINAIMPQIKDYYIAYDEEGSTRCGYLCAYKGGIKEFKKQYSPKESIIENNTKLIKPALSFYNKIRNGQKINIEFKYHIHNKRLDMIESTIKHITELYKQDVKPDEISVITPIVDEVLIRTFENSKYKINFQVISGNSKLNSSNIVKHLLIILKIINNLPVLDFELKSLFTEFLQIPYKKCIDAIKKYSSEKKLINIEFYNEEYDYIYKKLLSVIQTENKYKNKLSEQIKIIYTNLLKNNDNSTDNEKYEFLLKEAENFEKAFETEVENLAEQFITQIENSVISENPIDSFSLKKNAVIISTPQKIIDYSINTKYQIWLDISNNEWMKQDSGTLYNAWVLSRDWSKKEYTLQDNIELTRDKTARIIRKLMLLADNVILFSSIYDNTGNENFGGISDFIDSKEEKQQSFNIIPRDDQKPVLDYKKDKMGIMAVPGAGKTTILLALIIKMIKQGINPENIFVLTYMEAAAKNFKERIQNAIPDNYALPNISTIHGLALRIIKENGNYTKAGLDDRFEICDDTAKERIIKELFFKFKIDDEKYDNYLRCISIVKLSGNAEGLHSKYKEIQDFYNFYNEYNLILKSQNLIDYDDMLYFAVKILTENPEILEYYQDICKYIIEDEAQDSTDIQQKLITLLNGKYNNLVRCGDINQAITSTFTNSNLDSFKNYIKSNKKVEMVSSQRCAEPIYSLANNLIKTTTENNDYPNAFYNIAIKGTNKNPQNKNLPQYTFFDNEKEEKQYILQKTKEIKHNNPSASIAILLRLNSQVNEYNEYFNSNGIKTSVRSDCLSQKPIYGKVLNILKIVQSPLNNGYILDLAKEYNIDNENLAKIKELKTPFIYQNADDINNEKILQLYWDVDYWLNNSSVSADILALNIGLYYAQNSTDKSNAYMISTIIARLIEDNDNLDNIIKKLEYSAQRPMSAYKFFEDIEQNEEITPINIMTMHKSKGDEFDYVFIPELNEDNYSTTSKNVKLKGGSHFVQTIKNSVENCGIKQQEELKTEQVEETLRLLYVGITRAKQELFMTNAVNYKKRKNTKPLELLKGLC